MTGTVETKIEVHVPKDMLGKVIGKGRATQLDIESDYGVKLEFPPRDSDSEQVGITGPADKVEIAKRRVLDIIGEAPDVPKQARAEAQKLYDEADKLFEAAKAASGDEAHKLKDQAHAKRREAEAANEKAAQVIYEYKNPANGNPEDLDLHGLYLAEAMKFVEQRLKQVDAKLRAGEQDLNIIPGQGIHSSGAAKIKPAVAEYLTKNGYPFKADEAGGQFTVSFKDAKPEAHPAQPETPVQPTAAPEAKPETPVPAPATQAAAAPAAAAAAPAAAASTPAPAAQEESKDESWMSLLSRCWAACMGPADAKKDTPAAETSTPAAEQAPAQQQMPAAGQEQQNVASV